MPRPGSYQKPSWKNQYEDQQDFRSERRVSFKTGHNTQRRKGQNKDWSTSIRKHLEDEDIDMGFSSSSGRNYNNRFRKGKRGGKRSGSPGPHRKKLLEGPTNWYRVSLPYGEKYEKAFLQKILLDHLNPLPFWPIAWSVMGTTVIFYIEDYKIAEKLFQLDRQVQLPNGFKLIVKVQPGSPDVDVNGTLKDKIKLTMAKRYNSATKALDLTKFHTDPDLQDIFCALSKPIIFITVLDIISENIPEIEALNLFDNRITIISFMKKFVKKLANLKILHMGNNKIRDVSMLDALMGLPVVDLLLDGNPLCDKFKDQTAYVSCSQDMMYLTLSRLAHISVCSEVRKRFPKVVKLDGIDLPPPISFDLAEEVALPPPQQTFLCNPEGGEIVRQFLEQYFHIYDTENRQPLLQAYHENATFSLTCAYPYGLGKDKNVSWLNWYQTNNRNILRVQDSDRRGKLLKQGQLAVVSFIQEMPLTKHDKHSFTVDLTLFTPVMLSLTVTGIFRELKSGHKIPPTRYFYRTLIIVPAGAGFCITNEQVHITNATPDQCKEAFKTPIPPVVANAVAAAPPIVAAPDDATKQQMVQTMSTQSGMNLEWSMKCLEETQWNFERATMIFADLQKQGIIPPEAFVK